MSKRYSAAWSATIALLAALAITVGPASANGTCSTATPFARFGDGNSYSLLINGAVESGMAALRHTGTPSIVDENEPYYLHSTSDRLSLLLGSGDSVSFHSGCIPRLHPAVRFVARALSSSGSLTVTVRYRDLSHAVHTLNLGSLNAADYLGWAPSPILDFLNSYASLKSQTDGNVWVRLTPSGSAKWEVDDLYIDPYKAG